jgi:hypothetical protein
MLELGPSVPIMPRGDPPSNVETPSAEERAPGGTAARAESLNLAVTLYFGYLGWRNGRSWNAGNAEISH